MTLAELMSWFRIPGLSVAVIKDFQLHWAKGYGVADAETGRLVDTSTLFQAGSISKPVSAMAVLKAVQNGQISLDDNINKILHSWQLPSRPLSNDPPVTPRMLASHTSGLGDGFGFPGYEPGVPLPTILQILQGLAPSNTPVLWMERAPLSVMKYSGGGSTILQLALTDTLKRPFPEILRELVCEPAGMTDSDFDQPLHPKRQLRAARSHDRDGPLLPRWHVYPELFAAGLWTTATDLARFALEVQLSVHGRSNRILSRSMVQEMLNPIGVGDFAVGFRIFQHGGGWYMEHTGSTYGFSCLLLAHKLKGYGLVVMTNCNPIPEFMKEMKERVARAYDWDCLDRPVPLPH